MNKIMLIGNLGKDAETRYTPSGKQVHSFSMATNRRWTSADGQTQEKKVWFRVTLWGDRWGKLIQYLVKGKQVFVEGEIGLNTYEDREGKFHSALEVTAYNVKLLGGASRGADAGGETFDGAGDPDLPPQPPADDDIPF